MGVLGQVNLYLGLITLINTYLALFAAIGGQDGVDAGRTHWMTHSNYRTCHQTCLSGLFGTFGGCFGSGKFIFGAYYTNKHSFNPFHNHWRVGWGGCRQDILDDAPQCLPFWEIPSQLMLECPPPFWVHLGTFSKIHLRSTVSLNI